MKKNFYLTKTKSSPYWQIIYFQNGKRTTKSTGTKIKSEALCFLTQFKDIINRKKLPSKTLFQFEQEYINLLSNTHSKSYVEKSVKLSFKMLKKFINKDILLADITSSLADKFFSTTFKQAEYSARLYLRTLKSAFNKAVTWGYIEENVFKKIKLPKSVKKTIVYIKEDELEKICNATKEQYLKNLFQFAFYSGARLNEIISLKWDNINLEERIITISNTDSFRTKNKKDRIVPINSTLFEIIKKMKRHLLNDNEFIFYRIPGVKLNQDFVSKKFKKAVRKAGLSEKYHFHILRHSFASLLHQKGAPLSVIKELLGHSSIQTTLIYTHMSKENLAVAVELVSTNKKNVPQFSAMTKNVPIQLFLN